MLVWPIKLSELDPETLVRAVARLRPYARKLTAFQNCYDADDLLQEIVSEMWQDRMQEMEVRSEEHFLALCRMLLHRRAIDRIRSERSRHKDVHFSDAAIGSQLEGLVDETPRAAVDAVAIVDDLLSRLSAVDRRLLKARLVDKRLLHEIAAQEKISIATAHRRIIEIVCRLYHITNYPPKIMSDDDDDVENPAPPTAANGQPDLVEWILMIERLKASDAGEPPKKPERPNGTTRK